MLWRCSSLGPNIPIVSCSFLCCTLCTLKLLYNIWNKGFPIGNDSPLLEPAQIKTLAYHYKTITKLVSRMCNVKFLSNNIINRLLWITNKRKDSCNAHTHCKNKHLTTVWCSSDLTGITTTFLFQAACAKKNRIRMPIQPAAIQGRVNNLCFESCTSLPMAGKHRSMLVKEIQDSWVAAQSEDTAVVECLYEDPPYSQWPLPTQRSTQLHTFDCSFLPLLPCTAIKFLLASSVSASAMASTLEAVFGHPFSLFMTDYPASLLRWTSLMSFGRAKLLFVPPHFPDHLASSLDSPVDFSLFCHEVLLINLLICCCWTKSCWCECSSCSCHGFSSIDQAETATHLEHSMSTDSVC